MLLNFCWLRKFTCTLQRFCSSADETPRSPDYKSNALTTRLCCLPTNKCLNLESLEYIQKSFVSAPGLLSSVVALGCVSEFEELVGSCSLVSTSLGLGASTPTSNNNF